MGQDARHNLVAHWSTLSTLVDFSDPGAIGAFLSPGSLDFLHERMAATGYLDGADMTSAFRLLRPNSLIWHYVVHSYLYGEALAPNEVLFWNCDSTRMPAAMHEFYLRELYLNNRLVEPGSLEMGGRPLDLGAIGNLSTPSARSRIISPLAPHLPALWPDGRACPLCAGHLWSYSRDHQSPRDPPQSALLGG